MYITHIFNSFSLIRNYIFFSENAPQTGVFFLDYWRWSPSTLYGWAPGYSGTLTSLLLLTSADRESKLPAGNNQECVVSKLDEVVPLCPCFKISCVEDIRHRSYTWPLYITGVDRLHCRRLITVDCPVWVSTKEVNKPVVGLVWDVLLGQLLEKGWVTHCVKRLAEVECNDNVVWIGQEAVNE